MRKFTEIEVTKLTQILRSVIFAYDTRKSDELAPLYMAEKIADAKVLLNELNVELVDTKPWEEWRKIIEGIAREMKRRGKR